MWKKIKSYVKKPSEQKMLLNAAVSYVFVLLFAAAVFLLGDDRLKAVAVGTAVLYIPIAALAVKLYSAVRFRVSDPDDGYDIGTEGGASLDTLQKLHMPVVIFDENGLILWYNKSFTLCSGVTDPVYGEPLARICGFSGEELTSAESEQGLEYDCFGKSWDIMAYRAENRSKRCTVTVWHDRSEIQALYKRIERETPVVAYIMIDNLEELMQYVQEKHRTVAGEVENVLKEWAGSLDGIFREYERERYLLIFEASRLEQMIESRFDILDKVREIKIGDGNLPVTLSIGISGPLGSLADKENAARGALDMALQRGGDQVVVRTASGMEFYGGRSKGVSKRTKVRARVIANALSVAISKSSNVLIMGHRGADFDSLGSCVGIARLCMFCGVKVNIIISENDPNLKKAIERLRGIPEYLGIFVSAAEAQDMITSETLLVICDVNNREKFEAPDVADNVFTTVIIDHHRKTAEYASDPLITYIEPSASSSCELVVEILEQSIPAGTLPKDEADIMFAGILLDTKQFSRNTHTRTFSAALYLRGEGADPSDIQELFKTNLDDFMREAKFESNVELYREVTAISMTETGEGTAFDRIAAAKAADKLLSVEGVEASFSLCRIDDCVHISARSAGTINVQLIVERIGGGGRFDVAATQLQGVTLTEARGMLTAAIDAYLDEK